MGPVAFSLSTLRNMIYALSQVVVGAGADLYRRLGRGTVRTRLVSVRF